MVSEVTQSRRPDPEEVGPGSVRATSGEQIVATLGRQLTQHYGRSIEEKNLLRLGSGLFDGGAGE